MKMFFLDLLSLQEQHEKVFAYFFELWQPEMWMSWAYIHPHSCPFFICLHLRLKQMAYESWRTQEVLRKSCPNPSTLSGISSWFYWSLKPSPELSFFSADPNCSKTLPWKCCTCWGASCVCEGLGQHHILSVFLKKSHHHFWEAVSCVRGGWDQGNHLP